MYKNSTRIDFMEDLLNEISIKPISDEEVWNIAKEEEFPPNFDNLYIQLSIDRINDVTNLVIDYDYQTHSFILKNQKFNYFQFYKKIIEIL